MNREPKFSLKAQISHPPDERRSANYQPSTWSYSFLQSLKNDNADLLYKDKARKLEEEVRSVINDESKEFLTILELIDDIQRLGLEYLFKKDIKKVIDRFQALGGCKVISNKSLHVIALSFRLLRQHDEFRNFMDKDGNLEECFKKDEKGILSLYEASFFSFDRESLLDKAMTQTRTHLNNLTNSNSDISHALELPLRQRMVLSEARWYIEVYGKREEANPLLLELGKLNFNMVQSVLQRDLKEMSRWDVNALKDLPYYMKLSFLALYNTVNEMAYDTLKDNGEIIIPHLAKAAKSQVSKKEAPPIRSLTNEEPLKEAHQLLLEIKQAQLEAIALFQDVEAYFTLIHNIANRLVEIGHFTLEDARLYQRTLPLQIAFQTTIDSVSASASSSTVRMGDGNIPAFEIKKIVTTRLEKLLCSYKGKEHVNVEDDENKRRAEKEGTS
ncbi:hypothetical protein JCGZ_00353 [Jatropha curcas]|uniref:Terpene synthase N-terminal domain-containing protein n=1 Tax=Jatropha curcas TaxID=180498 RepID=A0A067JUF2_JATCU|nr:hypothetical protein JCGZ_00353 [Jatropha curcas]